MLTLIIKDIKNAFIFNEKEKRRALKIFLAIICVIFFALSEFILFWDIFKTTKNYFSIPTTIASVALTVISVMLTVSSIVRASRLFFDTNEAKQLLSRPSSSGAIVVSKIVALTISHLLIAIIVEYPIFIAYSVVYSKTAWFYYMSFAYPFLSSICEIGIAILLLYPIRILVQYLKKNIWVRMGVSCAITALILCPCAIFIHKIIELSESQPLLSLLMHDTVTSAIELRNYVIPINLLINYTFTRGNELFPYMAISIGILVMSFNIAVFFFQKIEQFSINTAVKDYSGSYTQVPVLKAILKKELKLNIRHESNSFVFPILILIQPYVLYLITSIIICAFVYKSIISTQVPNFDILSLMLVFAVMAVTIMIYNQANHRTWMEGSSLKTLKSLPLAYEKQIFIKSLIPLLLSLCSMLVSVLVLSILQMIPWLYGIFAFVLSAELLLISFIQSFKEELQVHSERPKLSYLSTIISCFLLIFFIMLGLLFTLFGLPLWIACIIELLVFLTVGVSSARPILRELQTLCRSKNT